MNHDSQRGYLKIVEDEMLPKILCGKKIFLDMRYFNMVLLIKAYDVTVIHSREEGEEGLSFQNFVCIIYIYIYICAPKCKFTAGLRQNCPRDAYALLS